jgi:DNA-directed RNA polymerase subunit RPC12/RpoP
MAYIFLRSYGNYLEANMTLQRLQEEGINCYIKDEHTLTIDPLLIPAMGGMKLMVHEIHAQRAADLLRQYDEAYLRTIPCRRCGAKALQALVKEKKRSKWMAWLGFKNENEQYYRCTNCGLGYIMLPRGGGEGED